MDKLLHTLQPDVCLQTVLRDIDFEGAAVIADASTRKLCLPLLPSLACLPVIEVAAGEQCKNSDSLQHVWRGLMDCGLGRRSLIVNVGGGSVSDLGGFAAATYMRGIRYINLPTTLLAAVDASAGGKTAIDFMGVKNLIGAFHAPECTIVSPLFLRTLCCREMLSGLAEMLKHAILDTRQHLDDFLASDFFALDDSEMSGFIARSAAVKSGVVAADPFEKGGRRKLNLGHTAGHALESLCMNRGDAISHGHAVAFGILAELSEGGSFPEAMLQRIREYVHRNYPVVALEESDLEELQRYMLCDKKNLCGGKVAYIRMSDVGVADLFAETSPRRLAESLLREVSFCGK